MFESVSSVDEPETKPGAGERVAVLVVGMHRSGTSAVTGTLTRLGLSSPATPVPPNFDNPVGFYESAVIVELNDRILKARGSSYDDWRQIDPNWFGSAEAETFVAEAILRYRDEYGASDFAVIKDPRICRLLPIWRRALDRLAIKTRVVFVYRSPLDVSKSLQKRNGLLVPSGLLLWLRHVLDAEHDTRDLPRCFIGMNAFLNDWRGAVGQIQEQLRLEWPRGIPAAEADIDAYLTKDLHHHTSTAEETSKIHEWAITACQALEDLASDPQAPAPQAVLDRIRAQFNTACDLFAVTATAGYEWAGHLLSDRSALLARIEAADGDRATIDDLTKRLEAADARLLEERETNAGLSETVATLESRISHLAHDLDALRDFAERQKDDVVALYEERDQAVATSEQHASVVARLERQLQEERSSARTTLTALEAQRAEAALHKTIVKGLLQSPAWRLSAPARLTRSAAGRVMARSKSRVSNPHFDRRWYLSQYPDVRIRGFDAYQHYLERGASEGRNPSASFDTVWYLNRYPDVREHGTNPLVHFWLHGEAEGRLPHPEALNPLFDTAWYVEQYGALDDLGMEPYSHYLKVGASQGNDPSPEFSTEAYLDAYSDVRQTGENPLVHYWRFGRAEGRTIKPSALAQREEAGSSAREAAEFGASWYSAKYPDVRRNNLDPWAHFIDHGEAEGRCPNAYFDPTFYRALYPDVRKGGVSPFLHFRNTGLQEGRLPREIAHPSHPGAPRILFIGHDAYAAGAQRVLLEVIGWFRNHTLYDISVLLLGTGHLTSDYARLSRTFVVDGDVLDEVEAIRKFVGSSPEVVYCNTVASGRAFIPELSDVFANSIVFAHCHELSYIIAEFKHAFTALCRRADYWICASPATTTLLRSDPLLEGRKIETVHAFIKPSVLSGSERATLRRRQRHALGIPQDARVVIGCGTLHWRKDPVLFVETAIELLAEQERPDVYFVWIGDGEDAPLIDTMVGEAGVSNYIRVIGYRPNAGDLLCLGDVFFLSSLEDPFPLVVLEAGQFGIPAVCFAGATGMANLIAEGGRVVPERDAKQASATLLALVRDEPLRNRLGQTLRVNVERRYTTDVQLPHILANLYEAGVKPAVSIVVPNYNHANFLKERLRSLLAQRVKNVEIIILDDASSDESLKVIEPFMADPRLRLVANDQNSGSVFAQWQRGVDLARSEVIWIAESDDSCEPDFLSKLLPRLLRADVNLAFGRTEIIDGAGAHIEGALQPYLDRMAPGFGTQPFDRSGSTFVNAGFGAICTIVNASGVLLRREPLKQALPEARTFRVCGDWRVYLQVLENGSLVYDPDAVNYFRRHTESTVHKFEGTNLYFEDRVRIAAYVTERFRTTPALRQRMSEELRHEADRFKGRYDADLTVSLAPLFASSKAPDFLDERIHVCFYVHGMLFSKGGIERLFSMISAALIDRGFQITLACAPRMSSSGPVFSLRPEVRIITTDLQTSSGVGALRRFLQTHKVDVFVPMLSESLFENAFEAADGLRIPIIASEHNNPTKIEERWWSREGRLACFAKADAIHLVADAFKSSLPEEWSAKIRVIPHGIAPEFAQAHWQPSNPPTVIAIGRLAPQKRFDLLIKAFALLAEDYPEWRLIIHGEGEERARLTQMVDVLDLTGWVALPGNTTQILDHLKQASLFVLSSEFEATGLALLEALSVGVPVVGFEDCEGNASVIREGVSGLLARKFTAGSLSGAMRAMMSDRALRERCSEGGRTIARDFTLDKAVAHWEKLILDQVTSLIPSHR